MPPFEQFFDPINPLSFVAAFALIWILVCVLISRIGGWSQLAKMYGSDSDYGGERWRFEYAAMRYRTRYNGVLTVGVSPAGLSLSAMFLFRIGHPPLLIPWSDIRKTGVAGWFDGQELRFSRAPKVPIQLSESLIEKIEAAYGRPIPEA